MAGLGYQYTFNPTAAIAAAAAGAGASVVWTQYYYVTEPFDPAEYSGTPTYKLVAVLQATSPYTAYARLYNVTDASAIGQATTTGTTPTLAESSSLTMPVAAKTLRVDFGCVSGQGPVYCYAAKVRVDF